LVSADNSQPVRQGDIWTIWGHQGLRNRPSEA